MRAPEPPREKEKPRAARSAPSPPGRHRPSLAAEVGGASLRSPVPPPAGSVDKALLRGCLHFKARLVVMLLRVMMIDWRMNVQYPYQLCIAPAACSTERPSPNDPDRPFQCPACGVRFTRIQNLKQHMPIHSGIKPFQCDRCGKKFTRAYSLKVHRLKHEVIS
ncbi:zinc finger and BTB domain-containing protein 44-like [Cebus imitator]|uniref:zinc finger and BTB domain-containing protein 44-like n=1 Tax=Cebus imitator TaxID=2715852 RepID=UPI00080A541E|nr:zinc finger and BTB domain-containing protein 44-like [Cebus imitator]